jgi:acyl-ACP thioesterase
VKNIPTIKTLDLEVRAHECGPDRRVHLQRIADYFQEAANAHSIDYGFSMGDLAARGLAWVLMRLTVRNLFPVTLGMSLQVRTWVATASRLLALRDFELRNATGRTLIQASTDWGIMDLESRRLVRLPEDIKSHFPHDGVRTVDVLDKKLPLPEAERVAPVVSARADLDLNGHVNSGRYLGWLMEGVPDEIWGCRSLHTLDVVFRSECGPGEEVDSVCAAHDRALLAHVLNRRGDGVELVRALSLWR